MNLTYRMTAPSLIKGKLEHEHYCESYVLLLSLNEYS